MTIHARRTHQLPSIDIFDNLDLITDIRSNIEQGDIYIIKHFLSRSKVLKVRAYLENIGKNSIPNYCPIEDGCPNSHRLNYDDERAYVKGCFHQFSFFPWNQDVFEFFRLFKKGYYLKNLINKIQKERFLGRHPEDGCIARVTFQFYPSGVGYLNMHSDPVGSHQLAIPMLIMSKKGEDFFAGGAYLLNDEERKMFIDEITDIGDMIIFNALVPHGVDKIDAGKDVDWLAFKGRWVMLFATNKLSGNSIPTDVVDFKDS